MNLRFLSLLVPAVLVTSVSPAQDADVLLAHARTSIGSMNGTFEGWILLGTGQQRVPFLVSAKSDGALTYTFLEPRETIGVRIGTSAGINNQLLTVPIRETGVTREDLSLWQLGWPGTGMSSKSSNGLKFHVVKVTNPSTKGDYGTADIWIHEKSLALFRIDAFDRSGKLARKMEVQRIKNFGDQKIAEQMRITTYSSGKKTGTAYVQLVNQR